jgi:hypothetical protein
VDRTSRKPKPQSRPCPWRASTGLTGGWHEGQSDAELRRGGCTWWNPTAAPFVVDDEDDEDDRDAEDEDDAEE